jgi:amino acid adenylation domain-containing protein
MSTASGPTAELTAHEKRTLLAQLLQQKAQPPTFPLSYGQQALWLTHQLAPESWTYHVVFSVRIRSGVDLAALQRAFQALTERHPVLHTTYSASQGTPEQKVQTQAQVAFAAIDASDWSQDALSQCLLAEVQQPFDLECGPVMRVRLLTRSAREHVLVLVVHHIAIDMWSLGVLLDELRLLYPAEKTGVPASLPALERYYVDYVRQQADMLAGTEGERLWAFWQQQLAGVTPVLQLPTDRPRPPVQTYAGATHTFALSAPLTEQLKALAQAEGATLYTLLLAAFDVLLYRYTGQEDILVGAPMANRMQPEYRRVVGYFVNPVVLRAQLVGHASFRALLGQARATVRRALEHQNYPFALLVERLQPPRHASRSPLFQVLFVLQQLHGREELLECFVPGATGTRINFGGLMLEPLALPQQEGQFDLTLEMAEVGGSLCGGLKYNADLFDAPTIGRMVGHLQALLAGVVANPTQPLSALPLLSEAERQQLLVHWNDTTREYPLDQGIHQLFEAQVERTPEAIAIVCDGEHLTYGELNRQANQLAHYLRLLGVTAEVLVGVCVERSLEMVVGLLGVLKAGGAYIPLDPAYPQERLAFMLDDTHVPVLLTQQRLVTRLPAHQARVVYLDVACAAMAQQSHENPGQVTTPEHPAYVIYTSGSTGRPKGVMGCHRGAVNRFAWMWDVYPFGVEEVCCQKTSLNFVDSVWEIFGPLLHGVRLVIIPNEVLQDPYRLVQTLAMHYVTRMVLVPSLLRAILDSCGELQNRLPQLKIWITSGESLPVELHQRFVSSMPHSALLNLYGSSEVAADVTWYDTSLVSAACANLPIGRPIANTQIYLLDAYQNPVPIGMPGELHASGDGLARGYLNRPALTSEKFIPDPFCHQPGARLYKTGDLARYLPDGTIEFLGRVDHQVKIRGFRIELGEVAAVLGQHPAVQEVAVIAREDVPGDKRLVAYLVLAQPPTLPPSAWRGFLKEKLPEYMIPAAFVMLDALPLTPNGKVNRLALPAPDLAASSSEHAGVAPRTAVEATLTDIWTQVLGIKGVGVYDNFFELGGHSLLAVQLMGRLHQTFARQLALADLFQAPTIADLARLLEARSASASHILVSVQPAGTRPPLFCLHPAGGNIMVYQPLAACFGPDQPLYALQSRALADIAQEHTRLDDMAVDYARAIRQQQPEGPYYLLGWSLGGVLAVVVAATLERWGQRVAFVGLLDTYLPTSNDSLWGHDPLLRLVLAFGGTVGSALAALDPAAQQGLRSELLASSPTERLPRLMAWAREHQLLSSPLPLDRLQQQGDLAEIHVALCKAHQVSTLQAPLYVWWARDGLPGGHQRTDWRSFTWGGMYTAIAEGNHFSMMQSPHIQTLTLQLQVCLQRFQEP